MKIYTNVIIGSLLIILFVMPKYSLAQTHVATCTLYQTTTSPTIACTFPAASVTGHLIVVHLDWDGQTRSVSTVTDNKGNTYAKINGPTNWNGAGFRAELWYAYNITGGGAAIKVTATLTGAPTSFTQIYMSEYSGIRTIGNPLDQNSVAKGTASAVSSGTKTTACTNELIYGICIGADAGAVSTGGGFNMRSSANANILEDKNAAAIGTYGASFTYGSGSSDWIAQMATFLTTTSVNPLPIGLLSFTGECNNNKIDLKWSTATEKNNDYFTVERSNNCISWEDIGIVDGSGNSISDLKYSFTAGKASNEIAYFRLKQTDFDGKFTHSEIVSISNCSNENELNIYPNPSNGIFNLPFNIEKEEVCSIEIRNVFGEEIYHSDHYVDTIDLSEKHNGIYFAHINLKSQIIVQKVVIKK